MKIKHDPPFQCSGCGKETSDWEGDAWFGVWHGGENAGYACSRGCMVVFLSEELEHFIQDTHIAPVKRVD